MDNNVQYPDMNTLVFGYIKDSFPALHHFHKRSDTLAILKTSQTAFTALSLASFVLAGLKAHEGTFFPTIAFLSASYAFFEMKMIAENSRAILESPGKEFRAILAKMHSDDKLWQKLTKGAPLARKVGLIYLNYEANTINKKPEPSFFSKIWYRK